MRNDYLFSIVLLFFIGMITSCAGHNTGYWHHPALSQQEASKQAYDCQFMAGMLSKGHGFATSTVIYSDQFTACMQSRGFLYIYNKQSNNNASDSKQKSPIPYDNKKTYSLHERTRIYEAWKDAERNGKQLTADEVEEIRINASKEEEEQDLERAKSDKNPSS